MPAESRQDRALRTSGIGAADYGRYRQVARAIAQRLKRRVRRLPRRQEDRTLKLISAGLAGPDVADTAIRQMLGPPRCNDLRVALCALISEYATHGTFPLLPVFLIGRSISNDTLQKSVKEHEAALQPTSAALSISEKFPDLAPRHNHHLNNCSAQFSRDAVLRLMPLGRGFV